MDRVKDAIFYTISERIGKLMYKRSESQEELAAAIGVNRDRVNNWLNHRSKIDCENLVKIAKHYDVPTDYLFGFPCDPINDWDLQAIAKYTGLGADTIEKLHQYAHLRGHESGILETFDTFIQLFYNRFALRLLNIKTAVRDSKDCLDNNSKEEIRWYNICYEDLREKLFSFSELCRAIPNELFDSEKIYKALDEKAWPASQVKETDIEEFLLSGDY